MNPLLLKAMSIVIHNPDDPEQSFSVIAKLLWEAMAERRQRAESEGISAERFGSLVTFACSNYGIATLIVAVILNRTAVIASTHRLRRRNRQGRWLSSFLGSDSSTLIVLGCLRLGAIAFMIMQVKNILTTLWVLQKTTDLSRLCRLTNMLPTQFFEYFPQDYEKLHMAMPRNEIIFGPTSAMLWPVFGSMCFSLFAETFCSSIDGEKPFLGGGTTLFEIANGIHEVSSSFFIFRSQSLAKRPTEKVLIMCLFLLVDHILSHMGSLVNRNKYRLIPLTITSFFFVWYFISSFSSGVTNALEFPFFFWLVYLCLIFVIMVSLVSLAIFLLAMLAKSSNIEELNYASYIWSAGDESEFFSKHLNLSLSQDFYSAMMNIGLFAVSLAGKSSYIKEYSTINHGLGTWLEDSLWHKIQSQFQTDTLSSNSSLVRDGKILAYLKANKMTGYSNVVNAPLSRLVNESSNLIEETERIPAMKIRYEYMKAITVRFYQLLYSYVVTFFIFHYIPKTFRKLCRLEPEPTTEDKEEAFELLRKMAPKFVQSIMKPPSSGNEVAGFNLENMTADALSQQYAIILRDRELADVDTSPDFILQSDLELDSEYDSDVELVNMSQARIIRGQEYVMPDQTPSTAFSEIMAADNIDEFLEDENLEILRKHLHHDPTQLGILTRSRYNGSILSTETRDETNKLLDLLLSKRQAPAQEKISSSENDDDDDIDPRFACVICQVAPREIITWPCKCFSICESCRLSLVSKGLEGCVTCRREVEGISRVFIP